MILRQHPTAIAFRTASLKRLTNLRYNGCHKVGADLAHTLIAAAQTSVGGHHEPASH
ncbi:MAG TPA: hypothetical protein VEI50_06100 [Nitrospiraceae bacterium]|nr:hypothetical protein [Nitrospiraceae bacterium]